jgi:hypothetical protein
VDAETESPGWDRSDILLATIATAIVASRYHGNDYSNYADINERIHSNT